MMTQFADSLQQERPTLFAWLCVLASVIFAAALNRLVATPVEQIRNRFKRKVEDTAPRPRADRGQGPVSVTAAL
jgi:peptidoglycan/LPS O-acetylase OafA/YrhL